MCARRPATPARDGKRAAEERSLTGGAASFLGSFPRADAPLDPPLPEVALIGRSNVGKSSLLNSLLQQKIAKVSGTPGKTRHLNVYGVGGGKWGVGSRAHIPGPTPHAFYVLDLPGYGYAKVSRAEREGFQALLAGVLRRPALRGIVWLLDIRHDPSDNDRGMQDLLAASGTRVLAAFTKADKLPRGRRVSQARGLQRALALDDDQVVTTSAQSGEGIETLRDAIVTLVAKGA